MIFRPDQHQIYGTFPIVSPYTDIAPWWLPAGVSPANAIAVYKSKGSDDYETSKVNLANPGTYDLTTANDPSWASATGWTFTSASEQEFSTGMQIATNWTFMCRFDGGTNVGVLFGTPGGTNTYCEILNLGGPDILYRYGNGTGWTHAADYGNGGAGVVGMAGSNPYKDGVDLGTIGVYTYSNQGQTLNIGGRGWGPSQPGTFYIGSIFAFAAYNTVLNSTQVGLLVAAMNAL